MKRKTITGLMAALLLLGTPKLFADAVNFSSHSVTFTSGSGTGKIFIITTSQEGAGYMYIDGANVPPGVFGCPYTLSYGFSAGTHTITFFYGSPITATGYVEYTGTGGGSGGTVTTDQIYSLLETIQAGEAANNAAVQGALNRIETTLASQTATLAELATDLTNLANALAAHEAARQADNAALNNKIDANQNSTMNQLINMAATLAAMQGDLAALRNTIDANNTALNSKIDANQAALVSNLDELAAEIAALRALIAANEAARQADQAATNTTLTNLQTSVTDTSNALSTLRTSVTSNRVLESEEHDELTSLLETLQSQLNTYGKQVALQSGSGSSSSTGTQLSTPSTLGFSSTGSDSNSIADYDKRLNETKSLDQNSTESESKTTNTGGGGKVPVIKPLSLLDYLEVLQ